MHSTNSNNCLNEHKEGAPFTTVRFKPLSAINNEEHLILTIYSIVSEAEMRESLNKVFKGTEVNRK